MDRDLKIEIRTSDEKTILKTSTTKTKLMGFQGGGWKLELKLF